MPKRGLDSERFRRGVRWSQFLNALKCALYLFMRIPQCDGSAMRTAHRMLGFPQFREQPGYLLGVERHVHLDGGMASNRGGNAPAAGLCVLDLLLPLRDSQHLFQHPFQFPALQTNRRGLDSERVRTEWLSLKTINVPTPARSRQTTPSARAAGQPVPASAGVGVAPSPPRGPAGSSQTAPARAPRAGR